MNKQHRVLYLICGLIVVGVLALWPRYAAARAYANVTLVSFTATSLPNQPEIFVEWETATQFETVGFFITRSDSATGTFTRASEFIPREGDDLTGWAYDPWIDETAVLGRTYWYKLEEWTTNQQSEFYGPVSAVSGAVATVAPTATYTPTPTRTPTLTPSPMATAAAQTNSTTSVNPTTSSESVIVVTPRVLDGATVTPRPISSGGSSSSSPAAATPLANVLDVQPQPQTAAPAVPAVPDVAVAIPASAQPAVATEVAQMPDPTLVPPDATPALAAPVIVVTEAAPVAAASEPANGSASILVAAAFLFLGIAFVILRQVRQ